MERDTKRVAPALADALSALPDDLLIFTIAFFCDEKDWLTYAQTSSRHRAVVYSARFRTVLLQSRTWWTAAAAETAETAGAAATGATTGKTALVLRSMLLSPEPMAPRQVLWHLTAAWICLVSVPHLTSLHTNYEHHSGGFCFTNSAQINLESKTFDFIPSHTDYPVQCALPLADMASWVDTLREIDDGPYTLPEEDDPCLTCHQATHPHYYLYIPDQRAFFHPMYLPLPTPAKSSLEDNDESVSRIFEFEYGYGKVNDKTGWLDACYIISRLSSALPPH